MKLGISIALFILISSCSSKEESKQTVSDQIDISLVTVMIDAGQEFLILQDQLYSSSLAEDKKSLINFKRKNNTAEMIDLDQLKLEHKIQYEKEGPNGLGNYPMFTFLSNENLLFWTNQFYKIFDQQGLLVKDLELDKIAGEYIGNNDYFPMALIQDENNPERVIGLITHWKSNDKFLIDFDLENQTSKKIDLPDFQKNTEYNVEILYDGSFAGGYGPRAYPLQADGKYLISSSAFNEAQVYDLQTDSLYVKTWDTPLLGYKKTYFPPETVDYKSGAMKDITRKMEEQISYRSFLWDEKNERYFRFSDKTHFGEELTENENYVVTGADVYLSVFDKDFNLLVEAQLPELTKTPNVHFAKEGNIWIFENIDDEMAFVIVKLEDI